MQLEVAPLYILYSSRMRWERALVREGLDGGDEEPDFGFSASCFAAMPGFGGRMGTDRRSLVEEGGG